MSYFEFPHTRNYDGDLGYVLKVITELATNYDNFFRYNTIKFADPIAWDITRQYPPFMIVFDMENEASYISKRPVPAGITIDNSDFWSYVGPLMVDGEARTEIERILRFVTDSYESGTTATRTYFIGEFLITSGSLYETTRAINIGEHLTPGYNITPTTIEAMIGDIIPDIDTQFSTTSNNPLANAPITNRFLADENDITANRNAIQSETSIRSAADTAINARIDDVEEDLGDEITARTQADTTINARIDSLINLTPGSTSLDAEVIDIRTGANGVTYSTAGAAVRGQFNQIVNSVDVERYTNVRQTIGKNLFDKSGKATPIIENYYRDYRDGVQNANTGWDVATFEVKAGETITASNNNCHVCFFSDEFSSRFISGFLTNSTNGFTFTTPAGTKTMSVSFDSRGGGLEALQVEYGGLKTPYASFKGVDENTIFTNVPGTPGINLFDKNGKYTTINNGVFRDYRDGTQQSNAGWEYIAVKVGANVSFAVSLNNLHVCFYSDEYCTTYISGVLTANELRTFTTPSGTKSMSISLPNTANDLFQLEYGTTPTTYRTFAYGIKTSQIVNKNVYTVGFDRDYTTIQAAINAAKSGDIIIIDPGTYTEALDMVGKNLHIIGAGADNTIIQYAGNDYYNPPLEASAGLIENVTLKTTDASAATPSYCMHADYDEEANNVLIFNNCIFRSAKHHCVGIGLRSNFTIRFTGCTFYSPSAPVYCHEQQASNITGQRIELIDCSIYCSTADSAIRLHESVAYTGNEMYILMQRVIAKANGVSGNNIIKAVTYPGSGTPTGSNYLNTAGWYLDNMSALNNESVLNA